MKRKIAYIIVLTLSLSCNDKIPVSVQSYGRQTLIYPDYIGVTVPSTIAPLNFSYQVDFSGACVTTFKYLDKQIKVRGRKVKINEKKWHKLLESARGSDISVYSSLLDSTWYIHVSPDTIDYGLNYRLIEPSYEIFSRMGIYERDLSSFNQRALFENRVEPLCMNCHSHCKGDPENMSLHIRGGNGCTLIMKDGQLKAFNTKTESVNRNCAYPFWHPSGKYICYSNNFTHQRFHISDKKITEIFDEDSDIVIYDVDNNQLILSDVIRNPEFAESFPSFSPDGKYLYYIRLEGSQESRKDKPLEEYRYSLMRVSFDASQGAVGNDLETLIDCGEIGKSVCMPKPSPDGRYIIYSLADYGCFCTWHHESDLYLFDLETRSSRRLDELNSPDSETCPSWGTNGKWIVFGSRRDDGLFTRAYIAHFDSVTGKFGKPFMLPQKDPEKFYSSFFFSYNIPEFVTAPMVFDMNEAVEEINSTTKNSFGERKN